MAESVVASTGAIAASRSVGRLTLAPLWRGGLLAFIASCATLVVELVAGRMLAPFVGVSLYTWTAIIGIVLAGVSLGNWLGGRLADWAASDRLLGWLFAAGAVSTLAALGIVALLGDGALFRPLPLLLRIFLLTTLLFLFPSLVLGMVTPVAIRLSLPDVRNTGRVVGFVYALGTVGSLVGNFLTGFVLTAYFSVPTILSAVALLLLIVAVPLISSSRPGVAPAAARAAEAESPRGEAVPDAAAAPVSAPGLSAAARGPLELGDNVLLASLVVVVSSFCTMAIELAASRIMAPTVGLSLYSWTGIIGVVLAGIALGNYLGGRIADRWPSQRTLGLSVVVGGVASLAILFLVEVLNAGELFRRFGLMERIVGLTAIIFFVPVLMLGTISPQVIRLAVTDVRRAGRVAGIVYAWSTAGAILGTFATGWWLISALGVHTLVFAMGLVLAGLGLLVGRLWRWPGLLAVGLLVTGGTAFALQARDALRSTCTLETNYFCIRVGDDNRDGGPVKTLVLDHLVHSYVRIGDPSYLGYEHEYVQAELTRYALEATGSPHVLVIGGGGYTYPRWVEAALPQTTVEVVEIDPGVTQVVHEHLGLPASSRIVSHNLDGRQFIHELAPKQHYAIVVQDAVNDLSVPYHIMTREYNDQVRAVLAPNGTYLLTVIDLYRDGQLLRSAVRTMMETFPQVQLLSATRSWDGGGAAVWVIAGSEHGIDAEQLREALRRQGQTTMRTLFLEPDHLRAYVDEGPQIILTDQYAPVDNLIAPLFTRRG